MIYHVEKEILKQKNFTGSGLEWTPKLLKAFSRDPFNVKTMGHSRFKLGQFSSTDLKIGSFIAK